MFCTTTFSEYNICTGHIADPIIWIPSIRTFLQFITSINEGRNSGAAFKYSSSVAGDFISSAFKRFNQFGPAAEPPNLGFSFIHSALLVVIMPLPVIVTFSKSWPPINGTGTRHSMPWFLPFVKGRFSAGNFNVAPASIYNSRLVTRSEEHTSELQSRQYLVCRLLLEK